MIYHLMSTTLDGIITQNILDTECYPIGRKATSFNKAFDGQNENSHLKWLNEPLVHYTVYLIRFNKLILRNKI
jgi:hypothetical protein